MRRIGGLLLGLVLVGWILIQVPVAGTEPMSPTPEWKRTVDGWERDDSWSLGPRVQPVRLHPAVVGTFELLASLAALLAFPVFAPKGTEPRP